MTWSIRHVRVVDISQVVSIEESSFPKPWDTDVFRILASWGGRVSVQRGKTVYMDVIVDEDSVLGYIVWQEDRDILQGHILNIAVIRSMRRRGVGRVLLKHAFETMRGHDIKECMLEVRESNTAAQALYASGGMTLSRKEPGYYEEEDALIYAIRL
ncbi:MAG: ribosomal protein S18-alanine N-acetyltransferase [Candidatus Thorarchaeota archaeon]